MNKCDFCTFSRNTKENGFYCPYSDCKLTQKEINEILKLLAPTLNVTVR